MDKRTYLTILYDYYGSLFNEHKRLYFEDYYFNNLSLSEMAENYNVSRSSIHKLIKSIEDKLNEYEDKLKLYEQHIKLLKLIKKIDNENIAKELIKIFDINID